jgi:hypothetical protein
VKNPRHFGAVLCHSRAARAFVIAIALAGCGGVVEASIDDRAVPDASSSAPPPTGCPIASDIDTGASLGKACAPEGTYCANPACDPCERTCPAVQCTQRVWTRAVNTALCTGSSDAAIGDASGDGAVCIDIDPSTFDQTCALDSDCFEVTAGTFCGGAAWCMCGFAAINVDGQSRYQQDLQDISRLPPGPRGCNCPAMGRPACVAKQCVLCGGPASTPGCPDAG